MNFAVSAVDSGLEVVVAVTQWLAQPHHPSVATRQSYMTNRVFDWMPRVDTVTINTGWFADNYMTVLGTIAQLGLFPLPLGDARTAPVSNEDIARVVVGALTNPSPRIGKYYRPTGPELLDPHQIAAVYAKVLGRPVKYQPLSERMFLKALTANDVVLEVGGSEPEDFETITRRYVAANPMAQRNWANKLRAVGEFVKILFARTPNLEAYQRSHHQPLLRAPKYGLDYKPWLIPHGDEGAYGLNSTFNHGHLQSQQDQIHEISRPSIHHAVA
jgi:hypothetical protein